MLKFDTAAFQGAIAKATSQITEAVDESSLRAAGFAGAEIFRDEAKRNAAAHRKTGVLEKNIIVKRLEEESNGGKRQTYLVTVRTGKFGADGDAFYWRFVAGGHKFVPRNKKVSKKTGKKMGWKAHRAAAELEYGTASAPAYPFIRPAFDTKSKEVVATMNAKLAEKLREKMGGK